MHKPGTIKSKVKSGCRTCKIRKVKCDEGKPSCHRCTSTGRACDGYGIWGGGSKRHSNRGGLSILELAPFGVASVRQQFCLEWFMLQTAPKLPGAYASGFWSSLVFRATSNEVAVLHAALTLSSVHMQNNRHKFQYADTRSLALNDECFTLQQYSKAINHLQPHFSTGTLVPARVTLVVCLLFVCVEFLRGQYQTAISHLTSGLKLLRDSESWGVVERTGSLRKRPRDYDDYWITETFCRLHVSCALFGQTSPDLYPVNLGISVSLQTFCSAGQARHCLDQLTARTIDLSEQARHIDYLRCPTAISRLGNTQKRLQSELAAWKESYIISKRRFCLESGPLSLESFAYELLDQYHTMTEIMAKTCLNPGDELQFDAYTRQFVAILEQAIPKFQFVFSPAAEKALPRHFKGVSRSICDLGCIPPLYYLALKCRVHGIRLCAVKLLKMVSHYEVVWHATTAASIAEEVMRIEEKDFYKTFDLDDHFSPLVMPKEEATSIPFLPRRCRVSHVQVVLPENDLHNLIIKYQRARDDGSIEDMEREFEVGSQSWKGR